MSQRYQQYKFNNYSGNNMSRLYMLSPNERQSVIDSGNSYLMKAVNMGDECFKNKDYKGEADAHRVVQDDLRKRMRIYHNDPESQHAFAYNSGVIYHGAKIKIGQSMGMDINQMIRYNQKSKEYDWIVPESVIPTNNLYNNYHNNYNSNNLNIQSNGFSQQTNDLVYGLQKMFGHI